ncbi:MAG: hypothetical protein M3P98_01970, partial [bacterium]|nr:hypothetical protein [bacterium]
TLGTDTAGNYVASITAGAGLTGTATGEGSTPTFDIVSANGGIIANADNIALTIAPSADGLSATTSSGSGMEILASGLTLLQGCSDTQILKWNEATDVWACSADAGGAGASLQGAYDTGATILTTSGRNIAFTLGEVATPTSFTIENQDTAGVSAERIFNSIASGTLTNGLLVEQTGAGTMTNGIQVLGTAGTISSGILIADGAGTTTTGLTMTGTFTNLIDTPNFDVNNAGNITVAAAQGLDTNGAGALQLGKTNATSIDFCNSAACDTINIGNLATTDADTITIGDALDTTAINSTGWSITGAGALTVTSCVGCGGSITKSVASDHVNATTTATKVTDLDTTLAAGTYAFKYRIMDTTTLGTTSPSYGVNFTGTDTAHKMTLLYPSTGTAAISGVADDVGATAGQIYEHVAVSAYATTTANMLHTGGQTVTNVVQKTIEGIIVVTVSGDLQLYHGSETANSTSLKAGSSVVITKIGAGSDLAEIYGTKDTSIGPGDVVSLDSTLNAGVKKSDHAYDSNAFGIISTSPSLTMGTLDDPGTSPVMVAFSGRVPVKVTTENGPIKFGDLLTSSSTPGVAMRATKAGQVIGQAMSEFDGEGVGKVMAFIKTDYSNGSKLADILPGVLGLSQDGTQLSLDDIGKTALNQFISQKETLSEATDLSEIYTDRLAAGLEIITPKVTTDEVALNSIEASTGTDINLKLGDDGRFVVTNPDGEETISFDAAGNANFKGTITADKVKANQIEGLEIFTDRISSLSDQVAALDHDEQSPSGNEGDAALGTTTQQTTLVDLGSVNIKTATVSLDMKVTGTLFANGGLQVTGPAEFKGNAIFHKLVTFVEKTVFNNDVLFEGRATFNNDAGGFATITAGQQSVRVDFTRPYAQLPVVTVNVRDGQFVDYAYKDLTANGFTIVLKEPATSDVDLAWTAVAVKDPVTQR